MLSNVKPFVFAFLVSVGTPGVTGLHAQETLEQNRQRLRRRYWAVKCHSGGNPDVLRSACIPARLITKAPTEKLFEWHRKDKMPMYVYVFDGDGLLMLKRFGTRRNAFMNDRANVETLKRDPSLHDPKIVKTLREKVIRYARGYRNADVMAMCVCHEGSYTLFSAPLDYDYSDHCLNAFRLWLKKRYATVVDLNRAWRTAFKSFDDVVPLTTDQKIDSEYGKYPYMDLSSWFEFREFL